MKTTVKQIDTLTEGMELIDIRASTPEQAQILGASQAARYTARGFASECVGVIEHTAMIDVSDKEDGYYQVTRTGYRPVVKPLGDRK